MNVLQRFWPRASNPEVALAWLQMAGAAYAKHETTRSKARRWYRDAGKQNGGNRAELRRFQRYLSKGRAYR
jgi:hypothetical protein